jgi:hypothetical protein
MSSHSEGYGVDIVPIIVVCGPPHQNRKMHALSHRLYSSGGPRVSVPVALARPRPPIMTSYFYPSTRYSATSLRRTFQ